MREEPTTKVEVAEFVDVREIEAVEHDSSAVVHENAIE